MWRMSRARATMRSCGKCFCAMRARRVMSLGVVERDDQEVGARRRPPRAAGRAASRRRRTRGSRTCATARRGPDRRRAPWAGSRSHAAGAPTTWPTRPRPATITWRCLRRIGRARRAPLDGQARHEHAVVQREQERRRQHRERDRERERLRRSRAAIASRVRRHAEQHERELAALREQQDEERPLVARACRASRAISHSIAPLTASSPTMMPEHDAAAARAAGRNRRSCRPR